MKKHFYAPALLLFCAAAAFSACQQEEAPAPEKVSIGFTATLADDDATKTGMTLGSNTASFYWEASDQLKVRQIYYRGSTVYAEVAESGTPVWNASGSYYSLSANFSVVNTAPDAHFPDGNKYMYQGFYPASQVAQGSSGKVTVTLPAQQTPRSEQQFDANADILYADAVYSKSQRTSAISGRTINGFTFHRLSSVGVMHLTGSPSILSGTGAAVQYVEFISTQNKSLAGTYTFKVDNPNAPTSLANKSSVIRMDFTGITTNRNNFTACFTCLPATCSGFTVRVVTTKGSYEKTFSSTQTFTQGQANLFTVSMSDATYIPKTLMLMTYNVAAFRLYDQFNLKHTIYKDNEHYWMRPGSSSYVLYDENDFENNKHSNDNYENITHAARIIATQYEEGVPMMVGFNELDSHLKRSLTVTAKVRDAQGVRHEITSSETKIHGYQLKQLKSALESETSCSWWYYFAKAKTYGQEPGYTIPSGEQSRAYGNGVISSQRVLKDSQGHYLYSTYSLGNGGVSSEEKRCIAVLETADCVFASVHMGGVASDPAVAQGVIADQINKMNTWFHNHYANYSKPVFVCGDFNAIPENLLPMMNPKWTLLSTTNYETHPSNNTCLDYIFSFKEAAQVQVVNTGVITDVNTSVAPYGVTSVSDHRPIYAKVSILP